ncbi:AbrB family transcriptional regulator [Paenibacillus wulumuqiensis]|uniref:AbrB family transcriptional regulator n=1 Tax=Paenibacillus wulumuqiensis TaxID=1567107 RepID=UPI000619E27A|nr:AbrB family transcriptional regulator [Paenibacillus wulumuqiensis]
MNSPSRWLSWGYTLLLALLGGLLFTWLHLPVPWLLGPMILVFIGSRIFRRLQLDWPAAIRDAGTIIVGYSLGLSLTFSTLSRIGQQLPSMIVMTVLLLLFSAATAYLISRWTGISFPTVLIGSIPGGLTQMVLLAQEIKGIDLTVVTFLQVSRLMMIVIFVPLLIFSPLFGVDLNAVTEAITHTSPGWSSLPPTIWLFAIVCPVAAVIGKRFHFPTAYMLLPMIVTAGIQLCGIPGPALPASLLDAAQLMIGSSIGLMLHPEQLERKLQMILLAVGSGAVLLIFACVMTVILIQWHHLTPATALLSMAPGGMDQMGIIAHEVSADIATVSCYQLFRTLLIFLAVPAVLRMVFRKISLRG